SYNWEDGLFKGKRKVMNKLEIVDLFNRVKSDYNLPGHVKLKFNSSMRNSHGGRDGISLMYEHHVDYIILHELAHVIHHYATKKLPLKVSKYTIEGHGPGWLSIYIVLLVQYGVETDVD